MKTEDYITKKKELTTIISETHDQICKLNDQYIAENAPFKIGSNVKVTNGPKTEIGLVSDYKVRYNDAIEPIINKINKDGSKSVRKIWVWSNTIIEAI